MEVAPGKCGYASAGVAAAARWSGRLPTAARVVGARWRCPAGSRGRCQVGVAAGRGKKASIGEGMLDMLQGGPKLRRWYGEQEMLGVGGPKYDEEDEYDVALDEAPLPDDGPKDTVLLLEGDSAMGEQLVLQLILARQKVRALVADPVSARAAFGPYVDFVQGDASATGGVLKGVQTLAVTGKLDSEVIQAAKRAGVERLLLLSSVGLETAGLSLGFLLGSEDALLKDTRREALVASSGVPYTVVRVGGIQDVPGGGSALRLEPDASPTGKISREDVARVLSAAAARQPPSEGVTFTVNSQPSATSSWSWQQQLEGLMKSSDMP